MPFSPIGSTHEHAIHVSNLTKVYIYHQKTPGLRGSLGSLLRRDTRHTRAVDDISLAIAPGEIVGFLGPNGAGKTTTLKMLCGLLTPTSGHLAVLGHVPACREPAYLRRISLVMGQKSMLHWDIPAMETLLLHRDLYRIAGSVFKETLDELVEMLDVEHLLRVQVRKLSLGERMKLELLAALIHRPEVLFLDEPTIGLDVVAQQRLRDFLRHLNELQGTTILLTSHDMDDIEALCPRVVLIDRGRLGYDGSLPNLIEQIAPHKLLTAAFASPVPWSDLEALAGTHAIQTTSEPGTAETTTVSLNLPRDRISDVAGRLLQLAQVVDLTIEEPPVEDIMRSVFSASTDERRAS